MAKRLVPVIPDMTERSIEHLKQMQSWSLELKIRVTQTRIMEWYKEYDGKVYVSFSGGKDSTVLLDLVRRCFPDVPAVFVDTGLEYPEIKEFAKSFDNVGIIRPKKTFRQVIEEFGYPVVSKEIAGKIYYYRKNPEKYSKYWDGEHTGKYGRRYSIDKWKDLRDSDIPVSSRCCDTMKKSPAKIYEHATGRKPFIATMACEGSMRTQKWLQQGCNAFNALRPTSQPMSFWTEQDVLEYIHRFNLPICSVYGSVEFDGDKYQTTKCQRTGCIFCLFGAHLEKEPTRLQLLHESHPDLWEYCLKPVERGGLVNKKYVILLELNIEWE